MKLYARASVAVLGLCAVAAIFHSLHTFVAPKKETRQPKTLTELMEQSQEESRKDK